MDGSNMIKKADKPDEKKPNPADSKGDSPPSKEDQKPPLTKEELAAAKGDEKKPAPTEEELKAKSDEFLASMFPPPGGNKKETKAAKPPEKPIEDAPPTETVAKPPEPEKKEPEAKTEPPPEKKKPLPPPIGEAVTSEQLKAEPAPTAKKEDAKPDTFTAKERKQIEAFARMEKDGTAPAGLTERVKAFWNTVEPQYIAQWEKENPGQKYDVNDPAHMEFYDKNEPAYDEDAFDEAVESNIEDRVVAKATAKTAQKTDADSYERQMREHAPRNAAVVHDAIKEMVAEAGFKDLMTKDGKLVLSKEIEAEIEKATPHAKAILVEEAEILGALVSEIDKLEAFPGQYQMQPGLKKKLKSGIAILPHEMLMDFASTLETELASQPPENTMRDGKRFVINEEFSREVERIMQSNAPEAAKAKAFDHLSSHYYTLTLEDTRAALIIKHSDAARRKIGKIGGAKDETPTPPPAKTDLPAGAEFKTQDTPPNRKAPSVSASDTVDTTKKAVPQSRITDEQFDKSMWG